MKARSKAFLLFSQLISLSAWAEITVSGGPVVSGVIHAFNLNSCPSGWSPLDGTSGRPDARGRTLIGAGAGAGLTNRTLASVGGEETHTLTLAELPSHSHSLLANNSFINTTSGIGTSNFLGNTGGVSTYSSTGTNVTMAAGSIGNTGSDAAHGTMMPFVALLWCVKD